MKYLKNIAILALVLALVPMSSFGRPGRKLPMGAYIKSAKIDILSGDTERYASAIAMLDSLFMFYGPTAEAIQLRGSIEVDYIGKTEDLQKKMEHVNTLIAYIDSLRICCDKNNKEVKKKYKKGCESLTEKNDSLIVDYWRQFYNKGLDLMKVNVVSLQEDITLETDSAVIARFQKDLQINVDSVIANYELCIALDSSDVRAYVAMRALYEKLNDYKSGVTWLAKGIEKAEDPTDKDTLLQTISYDYITIGDYNNAIPYMRDYLELAPEDLLTLANLAICYNNQKMYDSSFAVNLRVIEKDTSNVDALSSIGHYYRINSQTALDSVRAYKDANDEATAAHWQTEKEATIDSFLVYYKKVIDIDPQNEQIQYLYATYNYLRSNWEIAISSFLAAAEVNPEEKDYWRALGDSYVQTKEYAKSAEAYEKVVALKPTDKAIWEQLVSLYEELKKPKDKARAEKQLKSLE